MKRIEILDRELADADRWVEETAKSLGGDRALAHSALRAVLQTVRDCLQFEEAVSLGTSLPAILRGVYFEDWDPTPPPVGGLTREIFLSMVGEKLPGDAARGVEAVFAAARTLLHGRLTQNWPDVLKELRTMTPSVTEAPPEAAKMEKAEQKMEAAMERGEIDGFPEESYRIVLEDAKAAQPPAPSVFDADLRQLNEWIQPVLDDPKWPDPDDAFAAVRVVLQSIRDRLTPEEVLYLASQLPSVMRGFYLENWDPDRGSKETDLRKDVSQRFNRGDAAHAISATCKLLEPRREIRRRLPRRLRSSRRSKSV